MADFKRIIQRTTNSERVETGVADLQPNEICIVEDVEELVYKDRNGNVISVSKDKYTVDNIEDLKNSRKYKIGNVINILGYDTAMDGANHIRKISIKDDGSGILLSNGLWANIVHNGRIDLRWFGVSNFTEALEKSLNFCKNNQVRHIYIPYNQSPYILNKTLTIYNGITLASNTEAPFMDLKIYSEVDGDYELTNVTTIIADTNFSGDCMFVFEHNNIGRDTNYGIENIQLHGLNRINYIITLQAGAERKERRLNLKNVKISGAIKSNIKLFNTLAFVWSNIILDCSRDRGIDFAYGVSDFTIDNIYIHTTQGVPIAIGEGCFHGKFNGGKIEDCYGETGILAYYGGCSIYFSNLTFQDSNNSSVICNSPSATLKFLNCTFADKQSNGKGAIENKANSRNIIVDSCTFTKNVGSTNIILKDSKVSNEEDLDASIGCYLDSTTKDTLSTKYQHTSIAKGSANSLKIKTKFNLIESYFASKLVNEINIMYPTAYAQNKFKVDKFLNYVHRLSGTVYSSSKNLGEGNFLYKTFTEGEYHVLQIALDSNASGYNDMKIYSMKTVELELSDEVLPQTAEIIKLIDTHYYAVKMQKEGVYNYFIDYMDSKLEYISRQKELGAKLQSAYEQRDNKSLSYEEWFSEQPLVLLVEEEPQPNEKLLEFANKYVH